MQDGKGIEGFLDSPEPPNRGGNISADPPFPRRGLYVAMTLMLPLTVLNLSFCFSVTFLYLLCVKHFKCMNVNTNKQIKHALLHIVTHKSKRFSNATKKQEILLEKSDL